MASSSAFISRLAIVGLIGFSLTACSSIGRTFGVGKNPPDEFVVVEKRSLSVPPDFELRPPRPGESQRQEVPASTNVVEALFPGVTELPPRRTAGEQALLAQLPSPSTEARSQLRSIDPIIVEKGLLLPDILALGPRQRADDGATIERTASRPID